MSEPPKIRDLSGITAPLPTFVEVLRRTVAAAYPGLTLFVLESQRTQLRQDWLFAQGRTEHCFDDPEYGTRWSYELERSGGPRALPWHPGPVVTWTLLSEHTRGTAVDLGVAKGGIYLPGGDARELLPYRAAWRLAMALAATDRWPIRCLGPSLGDWGHYELITPAPPLLGQVAPARPSLCALMHYSGVSCELGGDP